MSAIKWLSVIGFSLALSGAIYAAPQRGGGGGGGHSGGGGAHFAGGGPRMGGGGGGPRFAGGGGAHFGAARVGGGHFAVSRGGAIRGGGGHFAGGRQFGGRAAVSHAARRGNVSHAARGGNFGADRAVAGHNAGANRVLAGQNGGANLSRHAAVHANAVHHALAGAAVAGAMHNHNALHNPDNRARVTAAAATAGMHGRNGGWWRHRSGGYGWVGPLFWPFAYYDIYDYALWDYGPAFWDYGYGDIYAGIFAPYGYDDLAGYLPSYGGYSGGTVYRGRTASSSGTAGNERNELAQMCGEDSQDIAGLPIERIREAIKPDDEQQRALDDLASATVKAAQIIKDACPNQVASTAPGRLAAMQARLEALISAVNTVEPPLDRLYGLLNDEQKSRLTALGQEQLREKRRGDLLAQGCGQNQQTDWPAAEIDRRVRPTEAQRASLDNLKDASAKAADMLKDTCAPNEPLTPPARLAAAGKRLDAMLQAVETVKSALDDFYAELSDEQKAQFESIGPGRTGPFASTSNEESAPAAAAPARRHHHHRRHYVSFGGIVRRLIGF